VNIFSVWCATFTKSYQVGPTTLSLTDVMSCLHLHFYRQFLACVWLFQKRRKPHLFGWMSFSGMWCRVDLLWTDVSEECIISIFRAEKSANEEPAWAGGARIFLPWRWRRYIPPKRRFTQDLHGVRSQKTAFFIVTAVITSNLTSHLFHLSHGLLCHTHIYTSFFTDDLYEILYRNRICANYI
jgi:hypothetical protein